MMPALNSNINFKMNLPANPIIFLPAFPLNFQMWTPQMDFLKVRNIGFIAVNYPGFGKSTALESTSTLKGITGMESYAEDIRELLKTLHIPKAIFVGLSMGGYVAFALYRKSPELFAGLVLANTRASADDEAGRLKRRQMIQNLTETKDPTPIFDHHLTKFFTLKTHQENIELVKFTRRMMEEATIPEIISAQQAMARRVDAFDLLPGMDFPVLLITGAQDELTTVADGKKMAERLRYSDLKIVNEAAHLSNLEKPELFNLYLSEYLERLNVFKAGLKK
jgi:3-oxoadipate enol-lactonase